MPRQSPRADQRPQFFAVDLDTVIEIAERHGHADAVQRYEEAEAAYRQAMREPDLKVPVDGRFMSLRLLCEEQREEALRALADTVGSKLAQLPFGGLRHGDIVAGPESPSGTATVSELFADGTVQLEADGRVVATGIDPFTLTLANRTYIVDRAGMDGARAARERLRAMVKTDTSLSAAQRDRL